MIVPGGELCEGQAMLSRTGPLCHSSSSTWQNSGANNDCPPREPCAAGWHLPVGRDNLVQGTHLSDTTSGFFLSKGRGLCSPVLGFSGVWEGVSGQGCTCLLCTRSFYLLKECHLCSIFFLWVKYEVFIQMLCWILFISMLLIHNMNLHSFLYRKPQNFGHYLLILLIGSCRAFTDILLSTVLSAAVESKPTVTNWYWDKRDRKIHQGTLLQLLTTPGTQSSCKPAEAVSGRQKNPLQFLLPGFRSPNCPRLPDKSETNHSLCASAFQTRKRKFAPYRDIRYYSSWLLQWG